MSAPEAKNANISLTPDALKDIISAAVATAVQEAKKPAPPSERELAEIQQSQEIRLETAQNVLAQIEAKKFEQRACTHSHATGESHCVFILDGNYVLCQKCQGKIRPEDGKHADKTAIYDTVLFNRLFQEISRTDM